MEWCSRRNRGKCDMEMNGRDARRKKIVERGSDRFALITGRIQALDHHHPDDADHSSSTHRSRTKSSPVFLSKPYAYVGLKGEGEHDGGDGGNTVDNQSRIEPQLRKCETNTEAIQGAHAADLGNEVQLSPVTARVPKASDGSKEPLSKASGGGLYFFTPKEISCCITASENTRVFCSIMIALLVVLSYVNLPRKIVKSKSIIASEPLYVLLLTDFLIVIALLILEKRRGTEKVTEEVKGTKVEDGHKLQFWNWVW